MRVTYIVHPSPTAYPPEKTPPMASGAVRTNKTTTSLRKEVASPVSAAACKKKASGEDATQAKANMKTRMKAAPKTTSKTTASTSKDTNTLNKDATMQACLEPNVLHDRNDQLEQKLVKLRGTSWKICCAVGQQAEFVDRTAGQRDGGEKRS
jgi:hypothetical protein